MSGVKKREYYEREFFVEKIQSFQQSDAPSDDEVDEMSGRNEKVKTMQRNRKKIERNIQTNRQNSSVWLIQLTTNGNKRNDKNKTERKLLQNQFNMIE